MRLLRSIDFPVDKLVLVLNQQETTDPFWLAEALRLRPQLEVVRPFINLGCAGGWNTVVYAAPNAPYWLICNNDIAFPPGSLGRIAAIMAGAAEATAVSGVAANSSSHVLMRSFALRGGTENLPIFALTREAVAWVGLFDENYWPVYMEDEDYFARLRAVGRGVHLRDNSVAVIHGPEDWNNSASGHYSGSGQFIKVARQKRDASMLAKQIEAADNSKQFCLKYGPIERPDCQVLEYVEAGAGPFGVVGASWTDWILDPTRRICSSTAGIVCGYDRRMMFLDADWGADRGAGGR